MTDKEIIKALECCTTNGASCKDCPAFVKVERSNCNKYFRGALALINRQQAEIERLSQFGGILLRNGSELFKELQTAKAEAVKEFAERLKNKSMTKFDYNEAVDVEDIDNLVKEMVGEG